MPKKQIKNVVAILKAIKEQGNTLVSKTGNLVSPEELKTAVKNDYLAKVKAGEIDMEKVIFTSYLSEKQKDGYISIDILITDMLEKFPEPVVETEHVTPEPVTPDTGKEETPKKVK